MSKKISIITPTYNSNKYIEKCIKSVLGQTYKNIEYIIIDGQSTDQTLDIISKYKNEVILISEKDNGNYDAIRKGFEIASGDILTWIDSDNFYENEKVIERVTEEFNTEEELDIILTNSFYKYEESEKKFLREIPSKINYEKLLNQGNLLVPESIFYTKNIYKRAGGIDLKYSLLADYVLWLGLFKQKPTYKKIDVESSVYTIRFDALLRKNFWKAWGETFKIGIEYNRNLKTKIKFYLLFIKSTLLFILTYPIKKNKKIRRYIINKYY
ncbi:glycosyltransferase [Candidatus Parcubacteria bacterium]|nr:glycosyltransferase [Candidatus Parcubacteria bacterium]